MSPLEMQELSDVDLHVNFLLYGPPKTGKTAGADSAPGRILHLNGDRPNAIRYAKSVYGDKVDFAKITGLQTLADATHAAESGEYATIVVDTVGEMYRIVLEDLTGRAMRPQVQWFGDTGIHIERFCRHLCELPVNVVLVCHEVTFEDEEVPDRRPFTGSRSNPVLGEKLMAMVDVFGYTGTRQEGEGDNLKTEYMVQLVDGAGRHGGSRFRDVLGVGRELDLTEWITAIRDSK